MIEPRAETHVADDGAALHVLGWPAAEPIRGRVVVLHGIQSHGGWYHRLGRSLAARGYEASFPDRRGSGANAADRGHAPSARCLLDDLVGWLGVLRDREPRAPVALAGISWGGKLATLAAARHPELVDALALIGPGLFPRVGVPPRERLRIALAWLFRPRALFPIPLNDPALFTANPDGRAFIAADPLALRQATAGLLAASVWLDRWLRAAPPQVRQPVLLMLAGQDRIIDNDRTRAFVERFATRDRRLIEYPEAHHTLEFEPDPSAYADDLGDWLDEVLAS